MLGFREVGPHPGLQFPIVDELPDLLIPGPVVVDGMPLEINPFPKKVGGVIESDVTTFLLEDF